MFRTITLLVFASSASLYSRVGLADDCHVPSAPTNFPEPATATADQILAVQQSVKQYLSAMEEALTCMEAAHNERARDFAVDEMRKTAAKYNVVLHAFKARQTS